MTCKISKYPGVNFYNYDDGISVLKNKSQGHNDLINYRKSDRFTSECFDDDNGNPFLEPLRYNGINTNPEKVCKYDTVFNGKIGELQLQGEGEELVVDPFRNVLHVNRIC